MNFTLKQKFIKYSMHLFLNRYTFLNSIAMKIAGGTTLHCLGDSHTRVFSYIAQNNFWWHTKFSLCVVKGATTTGLANPVSQTRAYPTFLEYLEKVNTLDHLLFCMGEVDCGFVIWYRAQKYGETVKSQLKLASQNYIKFIDKIIEQRFRNIILCSAPLPTILDNQEWGEVANARKEVKASLKMRTDLTREFNLLIKNYCQSRNLFYLDFEKETLDIETQVVKDIFRNRNQFDHHLDLKALSHVIVPKLKGIGYW